MIMMVLNKKKIKFIMITVLVIVLAIVGGVFFMKSATPTFNFFKTQDNLHYNGNKLNSKHVAIICNVDLGWESEYIEKILETLKAEKVNITFNVTGKWAEKNQDMLLKIKEQGHEIGNHGYKHLDYEKLSYEQNLEQIKTSKEIIEGIIKEETKFFQAPSGAFGDNTVKAASDLGYISIKWDVDTIDWKYREEPEKIIQRIKSKEIKDGSIILMHPTNATTQCLDDIINIVKEKQLQVGKLSDIFVINKK